MSREHRSFIIWTIVRSLGLRNLKSVKSNVSMELGVFVNIDTNLTDTNLSSFKMCSLIGTVIRSLPIVLFIQ